MHHRWPMYHTSSSGESCDHFGHDQVDEPIDRLWPLDFEEGEAVAKKCHSCCPSAKSVVLPCSAALLCCHAINGPVMRGADTEVVRVISFQLRVCLLNLRGQASQTSI